MSKLLKFLRSLKAKGFATKDEKALVASMFKELGTEDAEVVADDVAEAEKLPETDPAPAKEEEELEKNIKSLFTKAQKEITSDLKSEMGAYFKEQKEAIEKSAGASNKSVVEARKSINTYLKKFVGAIVSNDLASLKEMSTDSANSPYGGFAVNSELSAEIRALVTEYGVARQEMTTVALTKDSYKANSLVTDVTVYWVDEGGVIPSTQAVLGQDTLTLEKLGAIVTMTRELIEDQEIDLFGFIAGRVAEGFAYYEDKAFFTGTGTGDTANAEFEGVLNATGAGEVVMPSASDEFTDLTADMLLDMQDKAPQSVAKNGKYYGHRSIRNIVRKLKNSITGEYVYQDATNNGPALLWGRPFVEVEVMPSIADSDASTPFIVYGDLKKSSLLGYKGGIVADRFNAGTVRNVANNADINLITTDREAIRWIERVGYITILPTALVVLKTGSGS
jgi:HK97 family phage major capsid protein